jgi:hypothetical protein
MIELPGVIESGMPGRNGQRKPGTTRGSPRRSRTAKALRIVMVQFSDADMAFAEI